MGRTVFGIPDGSALMYGAGILSHYGTVYMFKNGKRTTLTDTLLIEHRTHRPVLGSSLVQNHHDLKAYSGAIYGEALVLSQGSIWIVTSVREGLLISCSTSVAIRCPSSMGSVIPDHQV